MNAPKMDVSRLVEQDAERKRAKARERTEMSFKEYLGLLDEDPRIAQNAHARHNENVCTGGVLEIPEHERWLGAKRQFTAISAVLYGIDHAIERLMEYIEAGAHHAALGRQVPLLVGPPGSGKSTAVAVLVSLLEKSVRPAYLIKGCPKFEEPLHLLPRHMRAEVGKSLGIRIEGDLCPQCQHRLKTEFTDPDGVVRWQDVPVVLLSFSKRNGRGISSFEPSGEKSEDVTKLSGRENIKVTQVSKLGYKDPFAYDLSGAIPSAERGLCEGRELLSSDQEVLGVFFSVAQERELKITNSPFPQISVDTLVIGHTNLTPYKKFGGDKMLEGLHRRFYAIPWPYALRIKDELALYRKLIEGKDDDAELKTALKACHIAPGALELAATFAVMTRLVKSEKGVGLLTKAKIYNGDVSLTELEDKDTRPRDLDELIQEGQAPTDLAAKEGMFGIDPRDILSAVSTALVKEAHGGKCLTPLSMITSLREVFKDQHRVGLSPEQIEGFLSLLSAGEKESVMTEYRDWVLRTVSASFLAAHPNLAKGLFEKYMKQIAFLASTTNKFVQATPSAIERDKATGKPLEADMKLIRSLEERIPWSENEARQGRSELLVRKGSDPHFSFETYGPLRKAAERKVLDDNEGLLMAVLVEDRMRGTEEKKQVDDFLSRLKNDVGFCDVCATELIEKAREFRKE